MQQRKVLSLKEIEALSQELSFMNYKPDSDTGSNMNWFNEVSTCQMFCL